MASVLVLRQRFPLAMPSRRGGQRASCKISKRWRRKPRADVDELLPLAGTSGKQAWIARTVIRMPLRNGHIFGQDLELTKAEFPSGHALVTDRMEPSLEVVDRAAKQLEDETAWLRASSRKSAATNVARSKWTTVAIVICSRCAVAL